MSNFMVKSLMHQIQFQLELHPRLCGGAYGAPADPLAGFKGLLLRGEEGKGVRGEVLRPLLFMRIYADGSIVKLGLVWASVSLHLTYSLYISVCFCIFFNLSNFVLSGRVALVSGVAGYSHRTFPWTICRYVRASVCRSVLCIVQKRRIGSGCRLAS